MPQLLGTQKSMYFFEKLNPGTSTYHHTIAMDLKGALNEAHLFKALQLLSIRHEALRSSIKENHAGEPNLEPIETDFPPPVRMISAPLATKPELADLEQTLSALNVSDVIHEPFDIEKGPLWRAVLVKFNDNTYQLLLVIHHLIVDVGSQNILLRDLSIIYNSLNAEKSADLPPLENLSALQVSRLDEDHKIDFWRDQLEAVVNTTLYPDFAKQKNFRFQGDRFYFTLDAALMRDLKNFAKLHKITVNSVLLAGLYSLLYRYTNEKSICLGLVSANRRRYNFDVSNHVNCFINSLPFKMRIDKNISFEDFSHTLADSMKCILENQLPLDVILQNTIDIKNKVTSSLATPYSILVNFNNEKTAVSFDKVQASVPIELNLHHAKFENFGVNFDLCSNGAYDVFIEFNTDLFTKQTIASFAERYQLLLQMVTNKPDYKIKDIPVISSEESLQLMKAHDNTIFTPNDDFIHLLFSRVASENKDKIAAIFHGENGETEIMTFAEMEAATNALAAYLIHIGVGPEMTVGLSLSRSINLIIATIAILKAGGVIVPLETKLHSSDFDYVSLDEKIASTRMRTAIVDNVSKDAFCRVSSQNFSCLNIDEPHYFELVKRLNLSYQPKPLSQKNLAYIIHTSGTTGKPKAVMIEHAGLTNLAYAIADRSLPLHSKVLCTAPPTFDCFYFELLEWLTTQGELHLINENERLSPKKLETVISDYRINCVTLLPQVLNNLDPLKLPSLVDVISMGSTPTKAVLKRWHECGKVIRNEYGPTETTICATNHPYRGNESFTNIGLPIRNTSIYILDENLHECPINIPGNIYISGAGLARGYLGNDELTQKKFPLMTFDAALQAFSVIDTDNQSIASSSSNKNEYLDEKVANAAKTANPIRFYATGDRGKYVESEGHLSVDFLGRTDRQLKLHGLRIEIDEIETLLRGQAEIGIKDIHLMPNDSNDGLDAYIVPMPHAQISQTVIYEFLKNTAIPAAGWPKRITSLESFPLNKNGKLDVTALPPHAVENNTSNGPQTVLQLQLAKIWMDILHCDAIDMAKTFREHGADSLSIAILETKLNQLFPLHAKISSKVLSRDYTVAELEARLITYLADKSSSAHSKPAGITSGITLFNGQKSNALTLQSPESKTKTIRKF